MHTANNKRRRQKRSAAAMPRSRIPLRYNNKFKLDAVLKYQRAALLRVSRSAFCLSHSIDQTTHLMWERKQSQLAFAVTLEAGMASRRSLGDSGRMSGTSEIEGQLRQYVKDLRTDEFTVSRLTIVAAAKRLMPAFFRGKSPNACLAWCARFMKRSRLTIRHVTHSGRKTRTQLNILKNAFVIDVSDVLMAYFIDPVTRLPLRAAVFNMDQIAIFCTLGSKTMVEFIGKEMVPAVCGGNDSWRCTVALTASAGGRMHAPHSVFKAEPGGEVEREVRAYAVEEVATFSVQRNAWFDARVILEWIEHCWRFIVSEPCILTLDSLAVHKCDAVVEALAHYGTAVKFVPGGCTGVAQPFAVGVMGALKSRTRTSYAEYYSFNPFPDTAAQRRNDMYVRTMDAIANTSSSTVGNSFHKTGPFIPLGPLFNESEEVAEEEEEEEAIVYAS